MEETFVPLRGIKNDLKGRLMCYKQDWTLNGKRNGIKKEKKAFSFDKKKRLQLH